MESDSSAMAAGYSVDERLLRIASQYDSALRLLDLHDESVMLLQKSRAMLREMIVPVNQLNAWAALLDELEGFPGVVQNSSLAFPPRSAESSQ